MLLSFLAKDSPDSIACLACFKLHCYSLNDETTVQLNPSRACYKDHVLGGVESHIYRSFDLNLFERTMKACQLGLSQQCRTGIYLLTDRDNFSDMDGLGFPYQSQAKGRVINGSLFLRVQQWFLIPSSRTIADLPKALVSICPHVRVPGKDIPYPTGIFRSVAQLA